MAVWLDLWRGQPLPEPDYFWKARGEIQELICAWLGTQYTLYKASNILLLI